MACTAMAYIVMAYIVMASTAMAYIVMPYKVMASAAMARKLAADGESEKPRPLPVEERTARLQAIKKKLGARNVKEETQPADLLVDKFVTMAETGSIRYLPWEDLTKWDTEIRGVKKDPHWKTTPDGLSSSKKQRLKSLRIQGRTLNS